jgi:hypothetical protein
MRGPLNVKFSMQNFNAIEHWQARKQGKNSTARHFKFGPLKLHNCWYIQLVWFISGQYMTRYCDLNNLLQGHSIPRITLLTYAMEQSPSWEASQ